MARLSILVALLFCCSQLFAIEIVSFKGDVTIGKQKVLKTGTLKVKAGTVTTGKASYIKLHFPENESILTLGPDSSIRLNKDLIHEHKSGSALFKFIKKKLNGDPAVVVRSQQASFGVRGTEFMSVVNPLLGETEIVTFEGQVEFKSLQNSTDAAEVGAGQWGGIGGRFGSEIGGILTLPQNVLDHFKNSFSF